MVRSTVVVALVLLVLIQSVFVESWWWRRRRKSNCSHPKPSQGDNSATTNDYFYGDMSLWDTKGKRTIVSTLKLRHSLLLFRGVIFEWGINNDRYMGRSLDDCKIKWSWGRKGESRCLLEDAKKWTVDYKGRFGYYKLFSNNCHHFVNRLGEYLKTNCGR